MTVLCVLQTLLARDRHPCTRIKFLFFLIMGTASYFSVSHLGVGQSQNFTQKHSFKTFELHSMIYTYIYFKYMLVSNINFTLYLIDLCF